MTTYPSTADACFLIAGTDQTVTLEGVPFDWNPDAPFDRDLQAAQAAARWFGENENHDVALILRWVTTTGLRRQ